MNRALCFMVLGLAVVVFAATGCGGGTSAAGGKWVIADLGTLGGANATSSAQARLVTLTPALAHGARASGQAPVGKLAYSEGYICTVNANGSGRRCHKSVTGDFPVWSSDGRRIAFERTFEEPGIGNERNVVRVMDADGTHQLQLTPAGMTDGAPAWSPVAPRIAFARSTLARATVYASVFVANADGTAARELESDATGPSWSPDGRKITFLRGESIFVMNSNGSAPRKLRRGREPGPPTWAPNGRLLLFNDEGPKGDRDLYVMRADGTGLRRLTATAGDDYGASWAPNSRRVVFTRETATRQEIHTVNADGTGLHRLTFQGAYNFGAAWSPDGLWIAFVRYPREDSLPGLYLMKPDGSAARRITAYTNDEEPAWRPLPK